MKRREGSRKANQISGDMGMGGDKAGMGIEGGNFEV
jgi:hypothetical protein